MKELKVKFSELNLNNGILKIDIKLNYQEMIRISKSKKIHIVLFSDKQFERYIKTRVKTF